MAERLVAECAISARAARCLTHGLREGRRSSPVNALPQCGSAMRTRAPRGRRIQGGRGSGRRLACCVGGIGMHRTIAVALCALLLSLPPRAYAQEASIGASPDGPRWYGWQTLSVDGIALGVTLTGWATVSASTPGSSPLGSVVLGVGLTGYALGPPLVHLAHGRWVTALVDAGIRLTAPIIAGAIGSVIDLASNPNQCQDASGPCGPFVGAGVGAVVGYAGAVAFDAVFLAREPGPSATQPSTMQPSTTPEDIFARTPARGFTLSPTLGAAPRGVSGGVVGSF